MTEQQQQQSAPVANNVARLPSGSSTDGGTFGHPTRQVSLCDTLGPISPTVSLKLVDMETATAANKAAVVVDKSSYYYAMDRDCG